MKRTGGFMAARPLLLEPAIIIVDNDPGCAAYISNIVSAVLGVRATIFSEKNQALDWCEGTVDKLAEYLAKSVPDSKGFSRRGLYRMRQFYETYAGNKIVSAMRTQLAWTNHLIILSKAKTGKEREFYIRLCAGNPLSSRDLEHQIDSGMFERSIAKPKVSAVLTQLHPGIPDVFRDYYSLDFLGLPDGHSEADLRKAIVRSLKNFVIEFGRDFAFIGEEYRVQVGLKDFFLDLLFYHRELRCLVAFELKIDEFKPEYLGKLSFYLEALDRDVKKPHENPSIGIILCKGKDDEVVEYALSRTLSPAAIADYATKLPDKRLLQEKLHEFFETGVREARAEYGGKINDIIRFNADKEKA
jgi:predicted nuclease of restriction endonuclease-like (RecB) superfamily